jgi:hypothetical protein
MGARRFLVGSLVACAAFAATLTSSAHAGATSCPGTFQVVNNDRIGSLKLPAGPYVITTTEGVGCQQAAALFNRFLQDWDGVLPNRWKVSEGGFRQQGSSAAFTVNAASSPPLPAPEGFGQICPGAYTLTTAAKIGSLTLKSGNYAVQLLSNSPALTCPAAYRQLSVYLAGTPGASVSPPWTLDAATATFSRAAGVGFRIINAGGSTGGGGSTVGFTCKGTFQVLHNDRINSLRVPAGRYYLYALGDIGCVEVTNRFRNFLEANGIPPKNWTLNGQTATFLYQGNRGFRVEPVNGV